MSKWDDMMNSTYIWTIDITESVENVLLEIFEGRNKFTKVGLFSGPLRRQEISPLLDNDSIHYLFSLNEIAQIGKNRFRLSKQTASVMLYHFEQQNMTSFYCRLADKKLHHVDQFVAKRFTGENAFLLSYDQKAKTLIYSSVENSCLAIERKHLAIEPIPCLYLDMDEKHITGRLTFLYETVEVQANSSLEKIELSSGVLLRNLQYERKILQQLYVAGGHQSIKNEVTFKKKAFFSAVLPLLYQTEIKLYWGQERKRISKAAISCSISYDIDWFSISGTVTDGEEHYDLSKLLHSSCGKSYVELKDSIIFMPDTLNKVSKYTAVNEQIHVPKRDMWAVHQIASAYQVSPEDYLQKFSDFEEHTAELGPKWENVLRSYQKVGVNWMLNLYKNHFSGCLADDMGLGKTVQAIAFLCCNGKCSNFPDLIVSPKIVLDNWVNELKKFAPNKKFIKAYGNFDFSSVTQEDVIYITTYDTLIYHNEAFSNISYDSVILDESQYIKNHHTRRYQALKSIHPQFILALSGTPIENSIEELWSLFNLLNPGMLGSHSVFIKTFASISTDKEQLRHLQKIIAPFLLRRTKETVLKDLPPKEECCIYCEMADTQRSLYDTLLANVRNEIQTKPSRYRIKDSAMILQALLYLREACSDPMLLPLEIRSMVPCDSCKFSLFQEYCKQIIDGSNKVIVYSLFPRVLRKMESWCQQQGWNTYYIDGTTNSRQKIVDDFEDARQGVFLISLKAGGVGLNLTSCQYVLIYDPWWNSAAEQQAANRVYRIGQDKPVFIYHFLVKDTIEEKIFELQRKKTDLSSSVLDDLDPYSRLSMEEICKLLL